MAKQTKNSSKPVYKKKPASMRLVIYLVILAFAGYMIYSNFVAPRKTISRKGSDLKQTVYEFTKHGELTFSTSDNEFISQIDIELADNDRTRSTGMMYRPSMKEDRGMFFIFPYENFQSFWMRNTMISLDIIFVNSKMEIVTIHDSAKPYDENSYASTEVAQYVVEVNGGYCERHNLKVGDKISWRRK